MGGRTASLLDHIHRAPNENQGTHEPKRNCQKAETTKPSNRPSTVAVLETPDGQVFYGQSGHGEPPDAALLSILENHINNFGCAEVSCLNQALSVASPDSLQGSNIISLKLRGPASNPRIEIQSPCAGGCDILLHNLGINTYP